MLALLIGLGAAALILTAVRPRDGTLGVPFAAADTVIPTEVWEPVGPAGISTNDVLDIEAAGQNTAYAVLSTTGPGKYIKTTDYGQSWAIGTLADGFGWLGGVSVVDGQTVWIGSVYSPGLGVALTTNGGNSWSYGPAVAWQYALEATSSQHVWIGGHFPGEPGGFIYETTDGGSDWGLVVAIGQGSCLDIESSSANDAWAVGDNGYSGRIWRCSSGSWAEKTPGSPALPSLEGCWALDATTAWAVGGDKIIRTVDGGSTWQVFNAPDGVGGLRDVSALSATTAFAVGAGGAIIKTTDGGQTWTRMWAPTREDLRSVYAVDATHAWAVGDKGTVLRLVQTNTRPGSDVTVDLGDGDAVRFTSVTAGGNTIKTSSSWPSSGSEFDHLWPFRGAIDVATSASYSGATQVRMSYDLPGLTEEAIRMLHKTGSGTWEDVTTDVDTDADVVTGVVTSLSEFTLIYPFAEVTRITPNKGVRGTRLSGVEISGHGFWELPGQKPTVKLTRDGQPDIVASNVVVHGFNRITCDLSIPAGSELALWDVTVATPDTLESTLDRCFRVCDPAPTVTGITPGSGMRGTTVAVTDLAGTGFWGDPTVMIRKGQEEIRATAVVRHSATRITCNLSLPKWATTGVWDVVVRNPDWQEGTKAGAFTVTASSPSPSPTPSPSPSPSAQPPVVASVSPAAGTVGSPVTLTGSRFGATRGDSYVSFGGARVTDYSSWSDTRIVCEVPAAAAGALQVGVTTPAGTSNLVPFKVRPRLKGITPKSGSAGVKVVITGSGFGPRRGGFTVRFGSVKAAKYLSWSAAKIVCRVPACGSGAKKVTVKTSGGTSNAVTFRVR